MPRSKALLFTLILLLGSLPAAAQEAVDSWMPPEPQPNGREWLRMSSGEWLMGDLKNLRDDDLLFDSEDLDDLKLDWDDVAELRSYRVLTYAFVGRMVIAGTALARDGKVLIDDGQTQHSMPRADLIGIIEGPPREINYWSAKLGFGFIGRSGNTDQVDFNSYLRVKRATAVFDLFIYQNLFLTVPGVEYFSDRFQNIDRRWTVAAAVGIYAVRNDDVEWAFSLGGGYQDTRYQSVEAGTDPDDATGTLIPSTSLDWDLTGALELEFVYNAQVSVPDTRDTTLHAVALLSVEIWNDDLRLETSVTWDRVEDPRPREDGSVPQQDDLRTNVGFALDL